MAYGNIVGYEPVNIPNSPLAAYSFVDKGGKRLTLTGAPAEDLKRRIDASAYMQPKVAGPGGGPGDAPTPAGAMEAAIAKAQASASALQKPRQGVTVLEGEPAAAAPEAASAAPAQPQAPQPQAGPNGSIMVAPGRYMTKDGQIATWDPGSAGSKGGPRETSRSVEDGFEVTPQMEEDRANISIDKKLALQAQEDAAAAEADDAKAAAEAEAKQLAREQAEAEAQNKTVMARVDKLQSARDQAVKDYASSKVDPNKAFASGADNWLNGILGIMGGIGEGMSGGRPNGVSAYINNRIDRSIRAQEAEIAVKRDNANNLLQDLDRSLGNRDLAKQTLGDIQKRLAANAMATRAAGTRDVKLKAFYLGEKAKLEEDAFNGDLAFQQAAAGHVRKQIVNVPGSAARKAGLMLAPDQLAAANAITEYNQKLANVDKTRAESSKTTAGEENKPIPTERTSKMADNAQAMAQARQVTEMLGNSDGEVFDQTGLKSWDKGYNNQLDSLSESLVTTEQKAAQIGSTKDDRVNVENSVLGNKSPNARRRGAQQTIDRAASRIAAELTTLSPAEQAKVLQTLPPADAALVAAKLKPTPTEEGPTE